MKVLKVRKRSGGQRVICAVSPQERASYRKALKQIAGNATGQLPAAHGFLAGRNAYTCAALHRGKAVTINMDLKDFFPSVRPEMVKGKVPAMLMRPRFWPVDPATGESLGCGQGLPTAPALANLAAQPLDAAINKMLRKAEKAGQIAGAVFTRYADDLSISLDADPGEEVLRGLVARVTDAARRMGFAVNAKKTRIMRAAGGRREIVGLMVGGKDDPIRPRASFRRAYRAMEHRARMCEAMSENPLAQMFQVGDKVRAIAPIDGSDLYGWTGTVVALIDQEDPDAAAIGVKWNLPAGMQIGSLAWRGANLWDLSGRLVEPVGRFGSAAAMVNLSRRPVITERMMEDARREAERIAARLTGWSQWMNPRAPVDRAERGKRALLRSLLAGLEDAKTLAKEYGVGAPPASPVEKILPEFDEAVPGHPSWRFRVTHDAAYYWGVSSFVPDSCKRQSCLNIERGAYRHTVPFWYLLPGAAVAQIIDLRDIQTVAGVKRPAQVARVLVFMRRDGVKVHQVRAYGTAKGNERLLALLRGKGFVRAGSTGTGLVVGHVRCSSVEPPYFDSGSSSRVKVRDTKTGDRFDAYRFSL